MADTIASEPNFEDLQAVVRERLAQNNRIRRNLPGGGRLRIDRQLPFLCVYRGPGDRQDPGTQDLVTSQAAYLVGSGQEQYRVGLGGLCRAVSETLREHFGVLLFLELWAQESIGGGEAALPALQPAFEIVSSDASSLPTMIAAWQTGLGQIRVEGFAPQVTVSAPRVVAPPGLPPLSEACAGLESQCVFAGLAVRPIYRDPHNGQLFPILLQSLRRQLAPALRRAIFAFADSRTARPKLHFDSLGPTSLLKAARLVDQQLSEVAESFDFLLQATPVNSSSAWRCFADSGYRKQPRLEYRPLPYHPSLLKRRLFEIPIERMEDPILAHIFWQKQQELDRQIAALQDLNTPGFLYGSLQLYPEPDEQQVQLSERILETAPVGEGDGRNAECVRAEPFAQRAREEIDFYRARQPAFHARVEICDHIAGGLMVTRDQLFVSDTFCVPASRVEPLLHHEVGTHLVTYFNGRQQPLRQLSAGLAGYDGLQEGLAILAEYVTGGLTQARLRTLAARVLAVRWMLDRASFCETFHLLHKRHGFAPRAAFTTVLRVYRGGGLTKDAIYLRGFCRLLEHLGRGHEVEPLYVGKIALEHVPFVQELRRRGIIQPPSLLPRFWRDRDLRQRLERCRGHDLLDLLETRP